VLRIVLGFLLIPHGLQKLFGLLGGKQVELASLMGLAGIIEFFGGILILVGLFTRPVTFALRPSPISSRTPRRDSGRS
jgi:putative oxidoreductase